MNRTAVHIVNGMMAVLLLLLPGCGDGPVDPDVRQGYARVQFRADLTSFISTLVVEVTAADIPVPIVRNMTIVDSVATGEIVIPAGSNRTITARAYDERGIQTHGGSITADVQAGTNTTLRFSLVPLQGSQPIEVTIGTYQVSVAPATTTLVVGESTTIVATVVAPNGDTIADPRVSWGSLNPAVASVDTTGRVTGAAVGSTQIVASYGGSAASATVEVQDAPMAALQLLGTFAEPVFVTAPTGEADRVFVVERGGRVRVIRNDAILETPFLQIPSAGMTFEGERGLLSMAFHPDYAVNGYAYVVYTGATGDIHIVRFTASSDPDIVDPASADTVFIIDDSGSFHNGGQIGFGPDGYLYISVGDDGNEAASRDNTVLHGKILRIDEAGNVPSSNPYVGDATARPEIWASGLRNPWRFAFDHSTGDLYISDVGSAMREEVNVQPALSTGGEDYGWNTMEGSLCAVSGCDQTGLVLPTHEYTHADGCSITGGFVYRGSMLPMLVGHYLYSDYCSGFVKSFRYSGGQALEHQDWTARLGPGSQVTSFGQDGVGELYIMRFSGEVYRMIAL